MKIKIRTLAILSLICFIQPAYAERPMNEIPMYGGRGTEPIERSLSGVRGSLKISNRWPSGERSATSANTPSGNEIRAPTERNRPGFAIAHQCVGQKDFVSRQLTCLPATVPRRAAWRTRVLFNTIMSPGARKEGRSATVASSMVPRARSTTIKRE